MAKISTPIWRDIYVDLGASAVPFRVRVNTSGGDIIYNGTCTPNPETGRAVVRLNDIAADYFVHTLPSLTDAHFSALTFPLRFYVEKQVGGIWATLLDFWEVTFDWSYDPAYDVAVDGYAFPIVPVLAASQHVLFTVYNQASATLTVTYSDGTTAVHTVPIATSADFNNDFNRDFARGLRSAGSGTLAFDLTAYDVPGKAITALDIDGHSWDVLSGCSYRYVLHYLNAYGGWDSLLVQGVSTRVDTLDRSLSEVDYDNRGTQNRGRVNYATDIKRTYTLNTAALTDGQAARMWHLLESTDVYLEDLQDGIIRPVVLTGTECAFRESRNNGHRFPQYTITAEVAQIFERR